MADDVRVILLPLTALMALLCLYPGLVHASDKGVEFAHMFSTLGSMMETLGTGSKCVYRCPNGNVPTPKPDHVPKSNGCGSYGLELDTSTFPAMTKCCNKHDKCYDTCGARRDRCDEKFKDCLQKICKDMKKTGELDDKQYDGCVTTGRLLYTGTSAMGCHAYKEAQRKACDCRGFADGRSEL